MNKLSVRTDIANKIKTRRNEIRLRQQELADKIGVSVVTIARWENPNSGRYPNSSILPKLAEALNTSVEYLMGLNDDATPPPSVKQELPINNMKEKENDDLDLGYWGAVVERAERAARSGCEKRIALIAPLAKAAYEALAGSEKSDGKTKGGISVYNDSSTHNGDNNY